MKNNKINETIPSHYSKLREIPSHIFQGTCFLNAMTYFNRPSSK